ncbi:MAG TPA: phosphatidylinositol kinase [Petrimonas sp.]|uniref:HipA N-terminal domain-containing protein n=1 Tax=Petrimonas sp. TaxID=2023866 RepID=UPI00176DD3CC|nr:phosphatidylinositol kinase [Petrimonas sp.]
MRQGKVFYKDDFAGILTETDEGEYLFAYDNDYIKCFPKQPITFSMPVSDKVYQDNRLFPFFEGLIPEGWLLEIASKSWKLNQNDRMGLLLACCRNCIGAVGVIPIIDESDE